MTTINVISLLVFTGMLATGQLLFKTVGLAVKGKSLVDAVIAMAQAPAFYGALALYGVSTCLWIWILSRIALSQAYPWIAVGLIVVPLLAWIVFGERVSGSYWFGVVLVIVGVLITQLASQASS